VATDTKGRNLPLTSPRALVDLLLAALPPEDAPVRAVLVGAHWTVVCSRHCGLASTLQGNKPHGEPEVRAAGRLREKTALELASLTRSDRFLEASIGVAAINSLLDVDERQALLVNAGEVLIERAAGKRVALVGHFPFIPQLRRSAGQLWVIEQQPVPGEYPAGAAADLIPQADIVALTGSALINHTLDDLLGLCGCDAEVMVLGASTPLSPVLFERGVSILSGARVTEEAAVLRLAGEGATFRQMHGVRLLTLQRARSAS
jgi:uncharacterized protein (DUF4213/DUF364 family)